MILQYKRISGIKIQKLADDAWLKVLTVMLGVWRPWAVGQDMGQKCKHSSSAFSVHVSYTDRWSSQ